MQAGAATAIAMLVGTAPVAAFELSADAAPVAREIVTACSGAIVSHSAPPEAEGWYTGGMSADAQAYVGHDEDYADKELPGIGMLNLSVSVDRFDDKELGRCSVRIDEPEGWLPVVDFGKAEGLVGGADVGEVVAEGAWRNTSNTLFVIARQMDDPGRFLFQMTEIADAGR